MGDGDASVQFISSTQPEQSEVHTEEIDVVS